MKIPGRVDFLKVGTQGTNSDVPEPRHAQHGNISSSGIAVNNLAISSSPAAVFGDLHQALRGRAMARNSVWNLFGQVLPLLVAAVVIPILIRRLVLDRFSVLTLAWALVGYFGLFDLGLGRALTKVVSEALAAGKE